MPARIYCTPGNTYGRLTFVRDVESVFGKPHGVFKCTCGNEITALTWNVMNGVRKSCGCLGMGRKPSGKVQPPKKYSFDSPTVLRKILRKIIERCENPKCKAYPSYGERGITICSRWKVFENFAADMGPRPSPGHSVDRINNDGNYEPGNCRWATRAEQQNNMRCNVILSINGDSKTAAQWSRELGIDQNIIRSRVKMGWSDEKILTTPVRVKAPKGSGDVQARYRAKKKAQRQAAA